MSGFPESDPLAGGAGVRPAIRLQRPENPLSLRTYARRAKRRLNGLIPPKFGSVAWLQRHGMLIVGRHSYAPPGFVHVLAGDSARVIIGNWCSLATDVVIVPGGNHRIEPSPPTRFSGVTAWQARTRPGNLGPRATW